VGGGGREREFVRHDVPERGIQGIRRGGGGGGARERERESLLGTMFPNGGSRASPWDRRICLEAQERDKTTEGEVKGWKGRGGGRGGKRETPRVSERDSFNFCIFLK
jgi:hypothetical protein